QMEPEFAQASSVPSIVFDETASPIAEEQTEWVSEPIFQAESAPEFVAQESSIHEPIAPEVAIAPAVFPEEIPVPETFVESPISDENEPVLHGQPSPYQTVVSTEEPVLMLASEDPHQCTSALTAHAGA